MIAVLLAVALALQFGQRAPLTPAETLLESVVLRAINEAPGTDAPGAVTTIAGLEPKAGTIAVTCQAAGCETAVLAVQKLRGLILAKGMTQPARAIWIAGPQGALPPADTVASIHLAAGDTPVLRIVRGLWSTAGIGDEAAEVFARSIGPTDVRPFENLGQAQLDSRGVSTTTIVSSAGTSAQAASVAAATAYFLATLPNAGAEALLAHLTVGAHARLAEDGRRGVALMGNQQRASADVLIMFGQAIEREQRRMRSFEHFMPRPVDPMLHSRILDMEKGITGVWTSIGITSSPFVPAAERIRGRGGDDRRVPTRIVAGALPRPEPPTAFLKFPNVDVVIAELGNFIDGKRTISDIRDAVSAECTPVALPVVSEYFDRLAKAGAISIR
jgi:hypothetical protein